MFLEAHFGDVSTPKTSVADGEEDELLIMDVKVDDHIARVDLISMVSDSRLWGTRALISLTQQKVESASEDLRIRVESVIEMALATMRPLSQAFIGAGAAYGGEGAKGEVNAY
jgi:cleavage and polyadenylation specificity factor subunit 3